MPQTDSQRFEQAALPHLSQAYNLARWLAHNQADAEDIVQEAYLRALRFYRSFQGEDMGPWLLKIVRNTYYTRLRQERVQFTAAPDGDIVWQDRSSRNPEELAIEASSTEALRTALEALPPRLRELLLLRELHDLSYREIAKIAGIPVGTVMSRLSRARARLQRYAQTLTAGSVEA